jgi:hypothetical protein
MLCLQLRAEHKAVAAKHGCALGLAALKDMPYTEAAIDEALRLGQVSTTLLYCSELQCDVAALLSCSPAVPCTLHAACVRLVQVRTAL